MTVTPLRSPFIIFVSLCLNYNTISDAVKSRQTSVRRNMSYLLGRDYKNTNVSNGSERFLYQNDRFSAMNSVRP